MATIVLKNFETADQAYKVIDLIGESSGKNLQDCDLETNGSKNPNQLKLYLHTSGELTENSCFKSLTDWAYSLEEWFSWTHKIYSVEVEVRG